MSCASFNPRSGFVSQDDSSFRALRAFLPHIGMVRRPISKIAIAVLQPMILRR